MEERTMTELTLSVTNGRELAAQTNIASAVKAAAFTPLAGRGLYDPRNEHDACGVGFIANMDGVKSHRNVVDGLAMLENLTHWSAGGALPLDGYGGGARVRVPD